MRRLDVAAFAGALAALVLVVDGGPGWAAHSARAVLAARLEHAGSAPLYDLVAGAAALVPAGELAFRMALLGAVLGALTLAGVVAASRALVPKEPTAGFAAALLLVLAPPFRDALATPQILAACGAVWAIAFAARFAREHSARDAAGALAACAIVVGSAPWLGAALVLVAGAWLAREHAAAQLLALAGVAIGLEVVALWWSALGSMPGTRAGLADAIAASGRGAGAIVVGAGLLGLAFGAMTKLAHARWLVALVAALALHEVVVGGATAAVLAGLALGMSIATAAIARMVAGATAGITRHAIVFACGLPFVLPALAAGIATDAPGAMPKRLADDLASRMPTGPGAFIATRATSWYALQYERTVAGMRPDLALVPPMPGERADIIAADGLRAGRVVGADAAAFGRLDVRRAIPRGRGFQLVGVAPETASPVEPPADYATAIGAEQARFLALERARIEAASGRLDQAARAAGLVEGASARFHAADLAVLAATRPSRPALFALLPLASTPPGPWLVDVFGDDLAWVAGIAIPPVPADAPMPRRLHEQWRKLLASTPPPSAGSAAPSEPSIGPDITALGPAAVDATTAMLHDLRP
jgi:hypothetical protein